MEMHPVEIINNEIISAGKSNLSGHVCLVHCRVNMGGLLEFIVKSTSLECVEYVS